MENRLNIFFDLDGTLYPSAIVKFTESQTYHCMRDRTIKHLSSKKDISIVEASKLYESIFSRYGVRLSVGIEKEAGLDKKEYMDYAWNMDPSSFMSKNPNLEKLLDRLRVDNSLFVLSDAPNIWINNVTQFLQIRDYFKEIFSCAELNIRKNEGLYLFVLNKLQLKPQNCLMIGDDPKLDRLVPSELAIRTILIGKYPDYTENQVANILEIEKLISSPDNPNLPS